MAEQQMEFIEEILDLVVPAVLKLSPDGETVIYSTRLKWNHRKGELTFASLWIAETGSEKSARQLTRGPYNDRMPEWSPDGKSIAFLSDRGWPGHASAMYYLQLDSKKPKAITPAEGNKKIQKFQFSPNGTQLLYISFPQKTSEKQDREEAKDDAVVWGEDWEYANLCILNIESGKSEIIFNEKAHVTDFSWNNGGTEIAIVTHRTPDIESQYLHGTDISVMKLENKEVRKVCHFPGQVSKLTWSGSSLYFMANTIPAQDTSGWAVYSIKLADKECTYERVAYGEESCAKDLVSSKNDILVHVEHGMEDQLQLLDSKILFRQKTRVIGFDSIIKKSSDDLVFVVAQGDLNSPTEVFSITSDGKTVQLSDHGKTFTTKNFGKCSFIECQTLDRKEKLDGLYLTPVQHAENDGKPKQPLPTVVLIHGGPYCRITDAFDIWDPLHIMIPLFLVEGYGVLIPNYRGSSSRGGRFASYARGGVGIYDEPDIVAMTQYAIEEGYADKTRLIAGGWSQGGHLSYLSAVRNGAHGFGWRFKGVIAGAGITDWDSMALTSDTGYMQAQTAGGSPWKMDKDDLKTRTGSALWEFKHAAKAGRIPPMLILHGEKDQRVPITQAWGFRRALDEEGLPFEFVTYPREGHNFTERKHIEDLMKQVLRFVKIHFS